MKKIIKIAALVLGVIILVSLFFYVKDKKHPPLISSDDLLKQALIEIRDHQNYPKAIRICRQALTISPRYTDIQVTLGRAYLLNGSLDSANFFLRKAIQRDKKHPEALQYLVNISLQQKDTVGSLKYLDQFLKYYPTDRSLQLKKYILLLQLRQYAEADRSYRLYVTKFNPDSIRQISFEYWQSRAVLQKKSGDAADAYTSFGKALQYQPGNPEILQQLVKLSIQRKDYSAAERYNQMYAGKALPVNQEDTSAKRKITDLSASLAKDENSLQKIKYAENLLKVDPSKKEALLEAINGHLSLHQYEEALHITNKALQFYPSDEEFINKKIGILYDTKNYLASAAYLESLLQQSSDSKYIKNYEEIELLLATSLIHEAKWETAITAIQKGLAYNRNNKALLQQLVNVYASSNRTADAIDITDQLLTLEPGNASYLFKKAGLLENQQRFEEAAAITYHLTIQHPRIAVYKQAYLNEIGNAEKTQLQLQQWDNVITIYNRAAATGNPGYYALVYALTAYDQKKAFTHTVLLTDTALAYFPEDSLFLVKRSLAQTSLRHFTEALIIDKTLMAKYPFDTSLRKMYLDQLYTAGKFYEKENNDSALTIFLTAFTFESKDTFSLQNLSSIYFLKKKYDSAIYYANLGLQLDSNNIFLLMKKASSYEQLKEYKNAYLSAARVVQLQPSNKFSDYAAYLRNKTYLNQLGISHLQSFFASSSNYASVTSIQYMRRFSKSSVTAKLNIGSRPIGTGIQAGLDAYYTHSKQYYSNAYINWSPGTAFPYWQGGYSLYRSFKKGWEGELGGRYLGFDSPHNYTAVIAAGKYVNSTWLNLRAFYTSDTKKWYQSYLLTARQYLNDKNDYLSGIIGFGGIPDDQSLNYNYSRYPGFVSKTLGVGLQKSFRYKTILNTSFNYTNLQVAPTKKLNQYDIYITLLRNF